MLPDTPDVELVLFGAAGVAEGAAAGSLVIDMSTIDPIATRAFAERLAANDVAMLDAPVSGGEVGADGRHAVDHGGWIPTRRSSEPVRCSRRWVRRSCTPDLRAPGRSRRRATSS